MNQKEKQAALSPGLYIVSTPIGNLEDITLRALRVLQEADVILAEDTRKAKTLLTHYNIAPRKLISLFSYNEERRIPGILQWIKNGQIVALISEAGTPLISDPGHRLVKAVIREGLPVVPIPGPSSVLAALVASGLPTDRFVFEGFLPRKKGRQKKLQNLCEETGTIILFESGQRVQKTIEDIVKLCGNRYIVLARELTKRYEEVLRGYATELLEILKQNPRKGEFVLLIAGTDFKNLD